MEKLAENDLTYFYLRHVVIVVTAVTMISLMPVIHAAHTIKGKVDNNTRRIPDWCPLSVTSFDEWQPTSAWTGVIHHQNPKNSATVDPFSLWSSW